ncbi:MAG: DUF1329 domain-containing protein [Candidatus Lernaella stagnicola]|nr:DUF1329 domain-containing protein [Candidatus Lernaella stagnicola]
MIRRVTCIVALIACLGFAWILPGSGPAAADKLTRANWGASVGFAPVKEIPGFTPGMTINAENLSTVAALVPGAAKVMISKFGMQLPTKNFEPYAPSDGYIDATNRYRGAARLRAIGDAANERELENYEGGMPFPAPQNGREVAWNYTLAYHGDDSESVFKVFWISARRGVERTETWKTISIHRAKFRTDVDPKPIEPTLANQGVIAATLTTALQPLDKKGFSSLYFGYLEPKEPEGWIYLPDQRRSIRLAFGTRGESWNNTDLLYEDVRGYTGSPEWMDWKIIKKATMLAPLNAGIEQGKGKEKAAFDFDSAPHWNPRCVWEPRPVYVLEATPRFKRYPYSRMVFTVDAESSYILTKEAYDRKNQLWKVLINAANRSSDPARLPPTVALSLVVDVQAEHATAFFWHSQKQNTGVNPSLFKLATLRKLGR